MHPTRTPRARSVFTTALAVLAACAPDHEPAATPDPAPLQAERQRPLTDRTFAATPERIARGEHLAHSILQCASCHSPVDSGVPGHPPIPGREFSGRVLWDDRDGERVVAPNLTPDEETGAGRWSDDMLARAIREGVGHDGRALTLPMYWESFRNLSDEDLASVVVYLRSLPPVANRLPSRRIDPERAARLAATPFPLFEPVPHPNLTDPLTLGTYLVDVADCVGCHTGWEAPSLPGVFAGGNLIWSRDSLPVYSKNITPDPSGIGGLSEEDFRWVMRTGRGGTVHPIMPWSMFRNLEDHELDAIRLALHRLHPVAHLVDNRLPPTLCPVCGEMHGLGDANVAPELPAGLPITAGEAEGYVGRYHHPGWDVLLEVAVDSAGRLTATEGGPPVPIVRIGPELFRGLGLPSPIRFERDDEGRVVAAWYQEIREEHFGRVTDEG